MSAPGPTRRKKRTSHGKTRSSRSGLQFPVARVHRLLQDPKYGNRIACGVPTYLTAVMECMAAELLRKAGKITKRFKKRHINPFHLQMAVKTSKDLDKLVSSTPVTQGRLFPYTRLLLKTDAIPGTSAGTQGTAAVKPSASKGNKTKMAKPLPKTAPPAPTR